MPLSVNIGLSRKASRDFQSSGTSINLTAELDATLLARPDELQQQIAGLYAQAERALDRQSPSDRPAGPPPAAGHNGRPAVDGTNGRYSGRDAGGPNERRGYRNGNGNGNGGGYRGGNGNGRGGGGGPATDSQRRAINAIAARLGVDPHPEARDIVGADLADLTIRQASDLIDHLKSVEPAGNDRPVR